MADAKMLLTTEKLILATKQVTSAKVILVSKKEVFQLLHMCSLPLEKVIFVFEKVISDTEKVILVTDIYH